MMKRLSAEEIRELVGTDLTHEIVEIRKSVDGARCLVRVRDGMPLAIWIAAETRLHALYVLVGMPVKWERSWDRGEEADTAVRHGVEILLAVRAIGGHRAMRLLDDGLDPDTLARLAGLDRRLPPASAFIGVYDAALWGLIPRGEALALPGARVRFDVDGAELVAEVGVDERFTGEIIRVHFARRRGRWVVRDVAVVQRTRTHRVHAQTLEPAVRNRSVAWTAFWRLLYVVAVGIVASVAWWFVDPQGDLPSTVVVTGVAALVGGLAAAISISIADLFSSIGCVLVALSLLAALWPLDKFVVVGAAAGAGAVCAMTIYVDRRAWRLSNPR